MFPFKPKNPAIFPSIAAIGFIVSTLAIPAVSAQSAKGRITMTDALGRIVTLDAPARRVISLTPAATEILFAVGAADRVVGVTVYCNYPAEALEKTKVGGFSGKTVSAESIVALKPDLVVISGVMHAKLLGLLEAVGIRAYAIEPKNLDDVYSNILEIGKLTGQDEKAARIVAAMRRRIESVERSVLGKPRPSVYWELWDDPLMSVGGPTFISEAIFKAGGRNIFDERGEQWPMVSLEQIIARKPAWLLSSNDHGDRMNLASVRSRPGWASIPAVAAGRIATVDADSVNRGGPRLADAIESIARLLHGESFR